MCLNLIYEISYKKTFGLLYTIFFIFYYFPAFGGIFYSQKSLDTLLNTVFMLYTWTASTVCLKKVRQNLSGGIAYYNKQFSYGKTAFIAPWPKCDQNLKASWHKCKSHCAHCHHVLKMSRINNAKMSKCISLWCFASDSKIGYSDFTVESRSNSYK